ncbi:type II toxin-antitoxin system HicB family antitoxin [Lysobacter sp. HA35]
MSELNTMQIGDYVAVVAFDPEIEMFRGEFTGLNGGADFYGASIDELRAEGETSLRTFLDVCRERGIEPMKKAASSYPLRLPESIKAAADIAARARNISFNKFVEVALGHELSGLAEMMRSAAGGATIVVGSGRTAKVKKTATKKVAPRTKKVASFRKTKVKGRLEDEKRAPPARKVHMA